MIKRAVFSLILSALAACGQTPEAVETATVETASLAPTAPVARTCPTPDTNSACKADTHALAKDYELALAGDYQAQRNIAWSFSGESDFITPDPIQACAWRQVIMSSRPADAAFADEAQLKVDCGKLTPDQVVVADDLSARIKAANA